ncbi:MAG: hypothetical protein ACE5R4_12660 [Armatimonadota bacterium]
MSTLQERLDGIKADFAKQAPAEAKALIARAADELRASGIMSRIPAPGSALPAFELPDTEGQPVRSAELLDRGPLVVSFYRGVW